MAVHQLVPHFRIGDATAQAAIHFRALLRRLGHWGGVFSVSQEPGTEALVQPVEALRVRPDDLVLLHHAIGGRLAGAAAPPAVPARRRLPQPLAAPVLPGHLARAAACSPGGRSWRAWRRTSGWASASPSSTPRSCDGAGYQNVHTVPLFVEPERFGPDRADRRMEARLASDAFTLVSVSRVRAAQAVRGPAGAAPGGAAASHRTRGCSWRAGGPALPYGEGAEAEAARTPGVTSSVGSAMAELVAAVPGGSAFVSMSEHEGFGVRCSRRWRRGSRCWPTPRRRCPRRWGARHRLRREALRPARRAGGAAGDGRRLRGRVLGRTAAAAGRRSGPRTARPGSEQRWRA